jgi:hypothetical protein
MVTVFRIVFFFLAALIILGCETYKNKTSAKPVITHAEDTNLVHYDEIGKTQSDSSQKSNLFIEKLRNKVSLDSIDYEGLVSFLITNNDESQSEEVGYLLYQFLNGNEQYNRSFEKFLSTKDAIIRDSILSSLIKILCLDLGEDNYTYQRLIKDFPLFKGNDASKSEFKNCMDSENL